MTGNRARRGAWTRPQSASIGCGIQAKKTCWNTWDEVPSGLRDDLAAEFNDIGNRGCEPQPSNIVVLSMGGTRAISKASFGRTARFGNCLPVLSQLAALEGRLSRQGTKSDGLNRCHGCAGLRTAFAVILGAGVYCVRNCLFLISYPVGPWVGWGSSELRVLNATLHRHSEPEHGLNLKRALRPSRMQSLDLPRLPRGSECSAYLRSVSSGIR